MNLGDVLLLIVRWAHGLAALAWIGGGIFYLLVLRPVLRQSEHASTIRRSIGKEFGQLIKSCMIILILSGVIMTLERLTSPYIDTRYVLVLLIKIFIAFTMFWLVRFNNRKRSYAVDQFDLTRSDSFPIEKSAPMGLLIWTKRATRVVSGVNTILVLGILVFLLADLLAVIYESNITRR